MLIQHTCICPNCNANDETSLEIEDLIPFVVATTCVSCANPYVISVRAFVEIRLGTVELNANKETIHA